MQHCRLLVVACLVLAASGISMPVQSAEREPFGQAFGGWRFTREPIGKVIQCRAVYKETYVLGQDTAGMAYVGVPAGNVEEGAFPRATIEIGGEVETIYGQSNGERYWMNFAADKLDAIMAERGFKWAVATRDGRNASVRVQLPANTETALTRLRDCVSASGG